MPAVARRRPRLPKGAQILLAAGAMLACGAELPAPAPATPVGAPANRPESAIQFDGERALRHLVELVERGHRHDGADERDLALAGIEADLAAVADLVERQPVTDVDPAAAGEPELVNVLARWRGGAERRVLLATHWDTRRVAEEDPDPAARQLPVPGANDGTSGVVILIELLRALRSDPEALPGIGVDVVLFDGEELGSPGHSPCCPGSLAFAERVDAIYPAGHPLAAIVVDMVGDRELTLLREASSDVRARWLNDLVWSIGRARAPEVFLDAVQPNVLDDHLALLGAGIPAVLLIDLEYDAWHTRADTAERVSAQSLATVGEVLLDTLGELARREAPENAP